MSSEGQETTSDEIMNLSGRITRIPEESERNQLINLINELINRDFQSLIQLLYRVDIDEGKLKQLLKQNTNADTAPLIADLIILRQLQKIKTNEQFARTNNQSEEEKW
jgi:hypothetical protein